MWVTPRLRYSIVLRIGSTWLLSFCALRSFLQSIVFLMILVVLIRLYSYYSIQIQLAYNKLHLLRSLGTGPVVV